MNAVPGALVELLNLPGEADQGWRDWYDRTYLAARASVPGLIAARRAVGVVGSVKEIVVYDLADPIVATSPQWQEVDDRLAAAEGMSSELKRYREGRTRVLYRQISSSVDGPYEPPKVEALHASFFEVEPKFHDELNDWYNLEHIAAMLRVPGYLNMRRFQGIEDNRKFMGLLDVVDLEATDSRAVWDAMQSPWSDRVRAKLVTYRERRIFRIERLLTAGAAEEFERATKK